MPKSRTKDEASATETYAKFIAEPFECQRRGSSEGQRRVCSTNGVGQKRIRGVGDPSGRPCPGRAKLKTETLNVIEPSTGRVLGTIEPDIIRLDKLLYIGGFHGWRAWECLSERERAEFELEKEDAVRFERAVM